MKTPFSSKRRRSRATSSAHHGIDLSMAIGGRVRTVAIAILAALPLAFVMAGNSLAQLNVVLPSAVYALGSAFADPAAPLRPIVTRLSAGRTIQSTDYVRRAARQSLNAAPLHAPALSFTGLALDRDAKTGNRAAVRSSLSTMRLATRISRRTGIAQTWLLRDAIRREDAREAIGTMDVIIRTFPVDAESALTQLGVVTRFPDARRYLRPYIRADNPWLNRYLGAALEVPGGPRSLALLLNGVRTLPDNPETRAFASRLTERLAQQGEFAQLRQIYRQLPGADVASSTTMNFDNATIDVGHSPVSWQLSNDPEFGATAVADAGRLAMDAFANPIARGVVARKISFMPAGRYILSWRVVERRSEGPAEARWAVSCGRTVLGASDNIFAANSSSTLLFDNPRQGCPAIVTTLTVAGSDGRDPSQIIVTSVAVRPTLSTAPVAE
jgi:hypothetical protein